MYGELYAIATALLRGLSAIPTKKGLRYSNPNTSALFSLVINTALQWLIAFMLCPVGQFVIRGAEYFVLAGIFAPGVARVFRDMGFKRLGVTITYPIVSTNTFFSMILAIIFLDERITIYLAVGAILIFIGVNMLTWQGETRVEWKKRYLLIPVIAALLFACSTNLRKMGLQRIDYPVMGAAITSTVSLTVVVIFILIEGARKDSQVLELPKEAFGFFIVAGIGSSVAFLLYFMALSASHVIKIQPIANTNPMFAIIFSYFFLRDEEQITHKTALGSLLILSGITLIFL